ncbi:MAG: response regulator [Elainellaceae cyanobacterium]
MKANQTILLAEDNRADILLAQRAFRNLGSAYVLHIVEHGDAAVDYLAGIGEYTDRHRYPFPNLLLLDLKMPRRSGFEVMEWLQQQPQLQLPVVVLTTSNSQGEIDRAYSLGAKTYLLKPITFSTMVEVLKGGILD